MVLVIAIAAPGLASAIGLGNIVLLSRIGEPLKAEVPVFAERDETPENLCFTLEKKSRNTEFPTVSALRTRIVQRGDKYILQLVGVTPIREPVISLSLRIQCGTDLQRDYVLTPEAPLTPVIFANSDSTDDDIAPPSQSSPHSAPYRIWRASSGETLESIANASEGGRRQLAAIRRANPHLRVDEALYDGAEVRIPRTRAKSAPAPVPLPAPASVDKMQAQPASPGELPKPRRKKLPAEQQTGDRLQLATGPVDPSSSRQTNAEIAALATMEERMLQLETSLQLLRTEIDKMDTAIALAEKASETGQTLRPSATLQNPPPAAANILPPPGPEPEHDWNWLVLLLSMTFGSGLAIAALQFHEQRERRRALQTLFIPVTTAESPEPAPAYPRQSSPRPVATSTSSETGDEDNNHRLSSIDIEYDEENSVLALAQALVARGDLEKAAHTLASHLADRDPDNFLLWNSLLNIYRLSGNHEEFDALVSVIHKKFNVEITSWEMTETNPQQRKSLIDYRHISEHLQQSWGTRSCMSYLYYLLHDTRAGQRHGFPLEVIEEIVLLIRILEDAYSLQREAA